MPGRVKRGSWWIAVALAATAAAAAVGPAEGNCWSWSWRSWWTGCPGHAPRPCSRRAGSSAGGWTGQERRHRQTRWRCCWAVVVVEVVVGAAVAVVVVAVMVGWGTVGQRMWRVGFVKAVVGFCTMFRFVYCNVIEIKKLNEQKNTKVMKKETQRYYSVLSKMYSYHCDTNRNPTQS